MWEDIGIRTTMVNMPYSAMRPTHVNRTAKGLWSQSFPPSDFEPIERYNILHSSKSALVFGFEHPVWQEMLDEANTLVDDEARWAKLAEMARWLFDNVMVIPVFGENIVWPLGPRIDVWDPLGGNKNWLSNWEDVPHRK